jgi:hypothetical protein
LSAVRGGGLTAHGFGQPFGNRRDRDRRNAVHRDRGYLVGRQVLEHHVALQTFHVQRPDHGGRYGAVGSGRQRLHQPQAISPSHRLL